LCDKRIRELNVRWDEEKEEVERLTAELYKARGEKESPTQTASEFCKTKCPQRYNNRETNHMVCPSENYLVDGRCVFYRREK
jgi:hypothetical protein